MEPGKRTISSMRAFLVVVVGAVLAATGPAATPGSVVARPASRGALGETHSSTLRISPVRVTRGLPIAIVVGGIPATREADVRLRGATGRDGNSTSWVELREAHGSWRGLLPAPVLVGSYPVLVRRDGRRLESSAWVLRVLPRGLADRPSFATPEDVARDWVARRPGHQVLLAVRRWHQTALDRRDRHLNQLLVIAYAPRHDQSVGDRAGIWLTIARSRINGRWQLLQATVTPYGSLLARRPPRSPSRPSETAASLRSATMSAARYSRAITRICRGALLFSGHHQIGTRAGAMAVSRDIRSTGRWRLRRVQAIPKPPGIARTATRWIATERKLDDIYAATYVSIWNQIQRASADHQRTQLPLILHRLLHRPDKLKLQARRLELTLGIPDCTGGG